MSPRTRKTLRIGAVILAAVAAVYVFLTVWSMIALHNAYAALKRDGRPMTLAEVVPPPVPDAENAAPLYEEAIRVLSTAKEGDETLLKSLSFAVIETANSFAKPAEVAHLNSLLARPETQEALNLVLKANERKGCRFELNYGAQNLIEIVGSHATELQVLVKAANREVKRLDAAGDFSNAWRLAVATMRLATAKRNEPTLLPQLVCIACVYSADQTIRQLCMHALPSQHERLQIVTMLANLDQSSVLQRTLDGERVFFGDRCFDPKNRQCTAASLDLSIRQREASYLWPDFMWRFDHAAYLRIMQQVSVQAVDADIAKVHVPWHAIFARGTVPGLCSFSKQFAAHLARVRCTEAGLAVLGYHAEYGAWPETLATCMSQVPNDPFAAGQALHYHITDKGFVVSSVGTTGNKWKTEIAWKCEPVQ